MWKPLTPLVSALLLTGCAHEQPAPADFFRDSPAPAVLRDLPPQVRSFVERKQQEAVALASKLGVRPDSATLAYFRLARMGQYRAASRIYQDLRERGGKVESSKHDPDLRLPLWDPLLEVQLVLDAYAAGAGRFATAFGTELGESIPAGSIYFGGTDAGRGLAAAFSRTGAGDGGFFVLTQNQLVDGQHIEYLRAAFGGEINIPSAADCHQAFQAYLDDAVRRYNHDQTLTNEPRQLRPGEQVSLVDGRPTVAGQVAVMALNGLLARSVFDKNPDREFYVEESFPIDWMYPHLAPHGLIMKINHQPLAELTPEIVAKDHEFWNRRQTELLGGWLASNTPLHVVCEFVERVFLRTDLAGFQGDADFVRNHYAMAAYSKLRSSQGGLYAWRASHSKSAEERLRMASEADYAFRQSLALCPTNPESVFHYVNLLLQTARLEEALLLGRTVVKLKPSDNQFAELVLELERMKNAAPRQK